MPPTHENAPDEKPIPLTGGGYDQRRLHLVLAVVALAVVAILGRLFWLQVVEGPELKRRARLSHGNTGQLYHRGKILDRNGVVLAQDTLLYDIYAHPRYFWDLTPRQIANAIAPILKMDADKLRQRLSRRQATITIGRNFSMQQVEAMRALRLTIREPVEKPKPGEPAYVEKHIPLSGLDYVKKTVRNYPQGTLAAHVLGYVNDEADIATGIEYAARGRLKKRPVDAASHEVDGQGNYLHVEKLEPETLVRTPVAEDVRLTIDVQLQHIAEQELLAGIRQNKARRGTAIMMDPKTGEVFAFAVYPSYQPSEFYKANFEQLRNWAITDVYPPGSTFKILTVACGIESGVIDKTSRIMDTGKMDIGGWTIKNSDYSSRGGPGMIDLVYLFRHSSNIASAKVAMMIPPDTHRALIQSFGFSHPTGIDLPGESQGLLLPLEEWQKPTTHATIGYGYGVAATPIQMITSIATIANRGIKVTPHLLQRPDDIVDAVVDTEDLAKRRVVSARTARTVTELLARSIDTNATHPARLEGIRMAGKTGTSRRPSDDGRGYSDKLYTSFVGFYPADNPKVLIMVVIDSPSMGQAWGSTVAAPVFNRIARKTLPYFHLQ